ncbi:fungal-specific transcription factor domain-containing protein [Sporodiniella umbellata]|nr:fungal-specific transcription factor domain-containing protein [Sporodiniella umbellata]
MLSSLSDTDVVQEGPHSSGAKPASASPPVPSEDLLVPIELTSISSEGKMKYLGEVSSLHCLAQKIDFDELAAFSRLGKQFKRLGDSLLEYETKSEENSNERLLLNLGRLQPGEIINGLNDWIYRVSGIDKATSDTLMRVYFAYIHPVLPVINKSLFLKQYREKISELPSAPLLNAIYGAAIRYIETCNIFGDKVEGCHQIEVENGRSEQLFENVVHFVKRQYNPSISTIQALAISNTHRASLDEKVASTWLLNCVAQHVGLHRTSDQWEIAESEKQVRKRVWWSIYILDKWSAASTGKPQTILDEDCDESYPNESASRDEVLDYHETKSYPSLDKHVAEKVRGEVIPVYQPFVQLVKLSEILGKILQGLYTPLAKKHSEEHGSDAVVAYLGKALLDWKLALPPSLQLPIDTAQRSNHQGKEPLLSMSNMLHLSYHTLLILLHRPFIEKAEINVNEKSSLSICTDAAERIVEIAENMHYRDFLLVSWNFSIYHVFTASLIHIFNATSNDHHISNPSKQYLRRAISVIERLANLTKSAIKLHQLLLDLVKIRNIDIRKEVTENPVYIPSDTETCAHSVHTNSSDDWINGLCSSLDPVDPSLFNYNIPQLNNTTNMMPFESQNSLESIDSLLLGYSRPGLDMQFNMMPQDSTNFRNRPDNPFWSVPSSIGLDEWMAYLTPEQALLSNSNNADNVLEFM